MICIDEDALRCDLAETYHIFNYQSLPVSLVATFSCGLREDSRIKLKMSESKITTDTILLATILDKLSWLTWTKTKGAEKGINKPKSVLNALLGKRENEQDIISFSTPEEYETVRERIKNGI